MQIKIYMVGSIGTNCYLVWDEVSREAMLIDPGDYDKKIDNQIKENGLILKYIVLTHGHYDHVLGVDTFLEKNPDAEYIASKADVYMIKTAKPERYLVEGDVIELGELSFKVLETPGHTKGGLSFYIPHDISYSGQHFSGFVFTGDTLFNTSIGRTDMEGGDFGTLIESIKSKLFSLPDDTLVFPGHMDPTTIAIEKKFNPFVK